MTLIAMSLDVFVARLKAAIAAGDRRECSRLMAEYRSCDEMAIAKGYEPMDIRKAEYESV